jgi:hypothetical protein
MKGQVMEEKKAEKLLITWQWFAKAGQQYDFGHAPFTV